MPETTITYFFSPMRIGCDGDCKKAWGINNRPKEYLSNDPGDYAFLADNELGEAPKDPGTYEGRDAKPLSVDEFPNKWCVRECERCSRSRLGEHNLPLAMKDFSKRQYNIVSHGT